MIEGVKPEYTLEGCGELRLNSMTMMRVVRLWLDTYAPDLNLKVTGVVYDMSSLMYNINVKAQE